jgi:hypothetical protein
MLSTDPSNEADVVVMTGGNVLYGVPENSRLYNEDSVFLHAVIDALRSEVERLEKEVRCRRTSRARKT